jgi:DNA uptake protein ComE-like DNA-binding protein
MTLKRQLKNFFDDFTYFSPSARRASLVITTLIVLSLFIPNIYKAFSKPHDIEAQKQLNYIYDSLLTSLQDSTAAKAAKAYQITNINTATKELWIALDVKPYIAERIEKYLAHGGKFNKPNDVLKIYGFDSALFVQIQPYLYVETNNKGQKDNTTHVKRISLIEINSADSITIEKLPGIGASFTKRIMKYRTLLGGYYSKSQLLEVFGFNQQMLDKIADKISIDTAIIRKISINTTDAGTLYRHPYIGPEKAKIILKYRRYQKSPLTLELLAREEVFNEKEIEKIRPYVEP